MMGLSLTEFRDNFQAVQTELSRTIVGHTTAIERLLVALFADGHVMLSGVPGDHVFGDASIKDMDRRHKPGP